MDLAYDHIQEQSFPQDNEGSSDNNDGNKTEQHSTLNNDLQEAYRAISTSPWGSKIGGFFGSVVKQVCIRPNRRPRLGSHLISTSIERVGLQRSSARAHLCGA